MNQEDVCCEVDHTQHDMFEQTTDRWDKVGIFLSSLCAIHCLAAPLVVLFLPVLGSFFENEMVHMIMALFVVPVGALAFWSGYRHHRQIKLFSLGLVGLLLVGGSPFAPHEVVDLFGHDVLTIVGSFCLIVAHVLNRRACLCHKH